MGAIRLDGLGTRKCVRVAERDLPTLPQRAGAVLRLANDHATPMSELERAISLEPSMAMRVLKMANSARYQRSREVDSVRHAVMLLGRDTIRELASAAALAPTFARIPPGLVDGARLWDHAIETALWTREVGKIARRRLEPHVFTAALMHDLGISVMAACEPERAREAYDLAQQTRVELSEAERSVIGLDHGELGAAVCESWGLPVRIGALIHDHHGAPKRQEVAVLRVAEHLARRSGSTELAWLRPDQDPPQDALGELGLDAAAIDLAFDELALPVRDEATSFRS